MSCPTCDHTLEGVMQRDGERVFHCPRCGTMVADHRGENPNVYVPKLVERVRQFSREATALDPATWHRLGIEEAIRLPQDRSPAPHE